MEIKEELRVALIDAIAKGNQIEIRNIFNEINKKYHIQIHHYVDGVKTLKESNEIEFLKHDIEIEIISDRSQVEFNLIKEYE